MSRNVRYSSVDLKRGTGSRKVVNITGQVDAVAALEVPADMSAHTSR